MIKSELVSRLTARYQHIDRQVGQCVVDVVIHTMVQALVLGQRIELRGFGSIAVKRRPAHIGRNPSNGEIVSVNEKRFPHFRAGKDISRRLNAKPGQE